MSNQREIKLVEIPEERLLQLAAEFFISDAATVPTAATRWTCIGNPTTAELNKQQQSRQTMITSDGVRRVGREHVTEVNPQLSFTSNCLTDEVIQSLMAANPDFDFGAAGADNVQAAGNNADLTDFDFDTGDDGVAIKKGQRTPILSDAGAHISAVSSVTLAGTEEVYGAAGDSANLVEDVDYHLDIQNGSILWLRDINNDVITGTGTWAAITVASNNYRKKVRAFCQFIKSRYFKVIWRDQDDLDNIAMETLWLGANALKGRLKVEGGFTADAQSDAEVPLMITVLNDPDILVRSRA